MPQIVKAGLGTADGGHNRFQAAIDGTTGETISQLVGENKPGVYPSGADDKALFGLFPLVAAQERQNKGDHGRNPGPVKGLVSN